MKDYRQIIKIMEKLYIENFGGITKAEIELNKINVFIGPQASGKSVCAKLFYFFKKVPDTIFNLIFTQENAVSDFKKLFVEYFEEIFPSHTYPKDLFIIIYEVENQYLKIEGKNKEIEISFSEFYSDLISWHESVKREYNTHTIQMIPEIGTLLQNKFFRKIQDSFQKKNYYTIKQTFIPAGRSFFSFFSKSLFSLLLYNKSISDKVFLEFANTYNTIKYDISNLKKDLSEVIHDISQDGYDHFSKLIESVLSGKYTNENDIDYLIHKDGRKIEVSFASSGQQESLPLILMLTYYYIKFYDWDLYRKHSIPERYSTLYIEEPEAHLFPVAQKAITELIASVYNINVGITQFIVTTHSPYIITAFDNLMQAGDLNNTLSEDKKKDLYNIVPKEQIISPDKVNAYLFDGGTCTSIIDPETKLIVADAIDNVSTEIAIQFDKLLDLDE